MVSTDLLMLAESWDERKVSRFKILPPFSALRNDRSISFDSIDDGI
jgi:hypothetical protein